jgi:hypothetical protein
LQAAIQKKKIVDAVTDGKDPGYESTVILDLMVLLAKRGMESNESAF